MNAGKLTPKEWKSILEKYDHSCFYCGAKGVHLEQEHKVPLIRGGKHNTENVVPACRECNARKYTKTDAEFIASR
jgi:5-methylcytosine-specific restriction endonuclease McrA